MTRSSGTKPLALAAVLAVVLAACGSTQVPTASPSATAAPTPSPLATIAKPTDSPPAASVSASPRPAAADCPVTTETGLLPSDRLVDLGISTSPTHDLLTFVFAPSTPGPAGPARGTLEAAEPPFSFAGSGQEFGLLGRRAVQLRFSGMTIADESGQATYHGPIHVKPDLAVIREAIQYDASEGIVGWYVGYDGPGCVALVRDGNDLTVMIAHAEAPAG